MQLVIGGGHTHTRTHAHTHTITRCGQNQFVEIIKAHWLVAGAHLIASHLELTKFRLHY